MDDSSATLPKKSYAYRLIDGALRFVLRCLPVTKTTEQIALWWGYRFRPEPKVVRLRSGALIQTTHVDHLQLLIYYLGTFEPRSLEYLRRCVKNGNTVLDVGANIGLFTVESNLCVGTSGKVISIEALPDHIRSLKETILLNKMENVELISCAVGQSAGQATLTLPRNSNFGMYTLGETIGDSSFVVPVRRIDDILAEFGNHPVDFIKMDIEGSEYRALLGATRTLSECHPPILIEINESALNSCGSSASQLKLLLTDLGYQGWLLNKHSPQAITQDQTHVCDECLFVHNSDRETIARLRLF